MPELVDLTLPMEHEMDAHPLGNPPKAYMWQASSHGHSYQRFPTWEDPVLNPDGRSFSSQNETMVLNPHTGTHMDAPVHVDPDSDVDIADVDVERLHNNCVLLDVSDRVGEEEPIESEDLEAAADAAGIDPETDIEDGDALFVRTDWSDDHYGSGTYFRHPGLINSSAKWCLEQNLSLVGIDCPNIDLSTNPEQPSHIGFLRRGWPESVLVIENLYNLGAVPEPTFEAWTLPLPIKEGSGSPCRVLANVE